VIALALGTALLVLPPAWRLRLAGLDSRWIGGYVLILWSLAMVAVLAPGVARIFGPILLIAWVAPFIVAPERMGRALRRLPRGDRGAPSDRR
jgi:hypothetical protein